MGSQERGAGKIKKPPIKNDLRPFLMAPTDLDLKPGIVIRLIRSGDLMHIVATLTLRWCFRIYDHEFITKIQIRERHIILIHGYSSSKTVF